MFYDKEDIYSLDTQRNDSYQATLENILDAKRIVLKFGTHGVNHVFEDFGKSLIENIFNYQKQGKEFIIVSSGAIDYGKKLISLDEEDETIKKSVYASIGQPYLMNEWNRLFSEKNIPVSQVLYENENLNGKSSHKGYIRNSLESALRNGIIPIANENDNVTAEEITSNDLSKSFGDNDNHARLLSKLVGADLLVFFTDTGGIYKELTDKDSLYEGIFEMDEKFIDRFADKRSTKGRGGLYSKLSCSKNVADNGIPVVIASCRKDDCLEDAMTNQEDNTTIIPKTTIHKKIEDKEF